jgi:hypothetical protein
MRATIVTLEPSVEIESVTFEQAFGESSDFKGRGREKRRKRRQERRMKRISDRAERKRAKQSMRAEQQEARQKRKDTRKERKAARKGDDEEESTDKEDGDAQPTESATTDSSSAETETQPESETTDTEQADELGDNSDAADEESSFDAETTGDNSSFDDENYDTETSEAAGRNRQNNVGLEIKKTMQRIAKVQAHIKRHKTLLDSKKLPSNMVARHAKMLKHLTDVHQKLQVRLANLKQMAAKIKVTPVKSALQAKFSKNKIVVPAKGADGEDSNMSDDFNNADGDDTSSFDGKNFVSKNKGILIGLGIGIVAILVLNKMKVFK